MHRIRSAGKDRVNGSIQPVSNPTFESVLKRNLLDKGAVPYPLHPPSHGNAHDDVGARALAHVAFPVTAARSRIFRAPPHLAMLEM